MRWRVRAFAEGVGVSRKAAGRRLPASGFALGFAAGLLAAALVMPTRAAAQYVDVLERPAAPSPRAAVGLFNGLSRAGSRVVAVGQRGHVLYSDDRGRNWQQARVPVSSDLTAVHFATARHGWAVGHDGVVLHSDDAGASWVLQLDGRKAVRLMGDYYRSHAPAAGRPEVAGKLAAELAQFAADGPDKPFLDVWFENERKGFVVGAFGLAFRTEDGGRSWQPWYHRMDNPRGLHIYALKSVAGDLYAVGEQGLVLKLDIGAQRFRALATPYSGTFFGVAGGGRNVLVFGLRGNAYRSTDGGLIWRKAETGVVDNITAGTSSPDGGIYLATQTGRLLVSRDEGASFAAAVVEAPASAAAVEVVDRAAIVAGRRGVRTVHLP